jgi:F-type H+-transporting ATPase subunit b
MELLTPSSGTVFWTVVTFSVLLFILYKVGWRPILQMLTEREKKIRNSLAQAERIEAEAEKVIKQHAQMIKEAKREAQMIVAAGKKSAEKLKEEIILTAHQEADQMLEKANREIEQSRDQAVEEIRNLAVELSLAATAKMLGNSLSKKEHQKLIEDSIDEMGKII